MVTMSVQGGGGEQGKDGRGYQASPAGDRLGEQLSNLYGGNPLTGAGTEMQMADRTWPVRRSWQESRHPRETTGYADDASITSDKAGEWRARCMVENGYRI